jgi:segregation and condensation protein A
VTFVVTTPAFSGPMDLLLHLINSHELDILDIPLSPLVDEYIAAVKARLPEVDVEELSGFLLVAAILLEMKSAQLLPGRRDGEADEEFIGWEERDVLLARLLELRTYAALADRFVSLFDEANRRVTRVAGLNAGFAVEAPDLLAGVLPSQIATAYLRAVAEKPTPLVTLHHVTVDAVTVAETVRSLVEWLPDRGRLTFREMTVGLAERIEIIVPFLAILELCKTGHVTLGQGSTFGEVEIVWVGDVDALSLEMVDVYEG